MVRLQPPGSDVLRTAPGLSRLDRWRIVLGVIKLARPHRLYHGKEAITRPPPGIALCGPVPGALKAWDLVSSSFQAVDAHVGQRARLLASLERPVFGDKTYPRHRERDRCAGG